MPVLGLCDGHDAGAAILVDGRVAAALSEERLTGRKRQAGFPAAAIREALRLAGVSPTGVRGVAVAERAGRSVHRALDVVYRRADPNQPMDRAANRASSAVQNAVAQNRWSAAADAAVSRTILARRLSRMGFETPPTLVDHHRAHALSAAFGSGFDDALVVTMDAFGDGASATVSRLRDGQLTTLARTAYPHSAALLFGLITAHLGFDEGDEGKVSGLAALGDPSRCAVPFARWIWSVDGRVVMSHPPTPTALEFAFRQERAEDVSAALQARVESVVCEAIAWWARATWDHGSNHGAARRLALAGGLFANVRLNQRVVEAAAADDVYVFPHMGDGGLCVGAAWAIEAPRRPERMEVLVGPEPGAGPLWRLRRDVRMAPVDADAFARAADRIAEGGVVGIARGRAEFGPRALGARSLLFSARRPDVAKKLGRALGRPDVMPFAPAVRRADFGKVTGAPAWAALSAMTVTVDARPGVAVAYPVAVHADGSMRAQIMEPDGSALAGILDALAAREGIGLCVNTSFNRHTRPIVNTAAEAGALFDDLKLAALFDGDVFVERL